MAYKILVSGKNYTLVKDFLQYSYKYFKCLSTSDCWHDTISHFELFEPEVFVYFVDSDIDEAAAQLYRLKKHEVYADKDISIILVASVENCLSIEQHYPDIADLLIKRPVSADNIALRIIKFLEKKQEAKEQELTKAAELALEAEIATVNAQKHLLIVDDDRNILKMLKGALSDNYEVTTIINGSLVEKIIATKKVDLVILDYEMPIETGADVFRKMKLNPSAKDIPVCFLTGVNEREKIEEVMSLRPDGYLLKPVNMDMLTTTIINLTS